MPKPPTMALSSFTVRSPWSSMKVASVNSSMYFNVYGRSGWRLTWTRSHAERLAYRFLRVSASFFSRSFSVDLNVVRKRPDGYHDIESVLVPVPLCDILEAVADERLAPGAVMFTRSGLAVPGDMEQDLCMKAIRSIGRVHDLPGIRMHLHKVIPMGAGLGGGSSDGARTLILLNELLDLGASEEELHSLALGL